MLNIHIRAKPSKIEGDISLEDYDYDDDTTTTVTSDDKTRSKRPNRQKRDLLLITSK